VPSVPEENLSHLVTPSESAPREETQSEPEDETSRTVAHNSYDENYRVAHSATDNHSIGHRHGEGTSSGGGLLSLLTPEPGSSDNGPSAPKRKKKKRRYGRQQ
jgi:hypothetical protein